MPELFNQLEVVQRLLRAALAAALGPDTCGHRPAADGGDGDPVDHGLQLLDTPIALQVRSAGQGGLRYLNLHENEQTAVLAAADLLRTVPGQLIELRSRGRRVVSFRDGLRPLAFDPNRIFSDAGIQQTLRRHASCTPAAQQALRTLRDRVLALICRGAARPPCRAAPHAGRGGGAARLSSAVAARASGRQEAHQPLPDDRVGLGHDAVGQRFAAGDVMDQPGHCATMPHDQAPASIAPSSVIFG